jgi:Domain of unknown function (DUF6458)
MILIALGAVLAFAVDQDSSSAVDVNVVGWVLLAVGAIGLLLSLLLWERWGPGYWTSRRRVYDASVGDAYAGPYADPYARRGWGYGRRRRVVDEDAGPGPAGPYDEPPPP